LQYVAICVDLDLCSTRRGWSFLLIAYQLRASMQLYSIHDANKLRGAYHSTKLSYSIRT
jgi:hypothetical protein